MKRMRGAELKSQAKAWFGEENWRSPLAGALGVAPSTIYRMISEDRVSGPVAAAVRAWQEHGLPVSVKRVRAPKPRRPIPPR